VRTFLPVLSFLLTATPLQGVAADEDAFLRLKQLEGTWYVIDTQGRATAQVASVFRVTANGHSVQEIMYPGTAHEMVNMYYRDGGEVRVTHYCAGGNQPTLRLVPAGKPGVFNLEFVDITNMLTIDDEHMHEGRYEWLGADRLRIEWRSFEAGRQSSTSQLEMVRRR
jgi:hypothetical protein